MELPNIEPEVFQTLHRNKSADFQAKLEEIGSVEEVNAHNLLQVAFAVLDGGGEDAGKVIGLSVFDAGRPGLCSTGTRAARTARPSLRAQTPHPDPASRRRVPCPSCTTLVPSVLRGLRRPS